MKISLKPEFLAYFFPDLVGQFVPDYPSKDGVIIFPKLLMGLKSAQQ
jgi:hypothetical protein